MPLSFQTFLSIYNRAFTLLYFVCCIFFVISDISFASYADDNTPYTAADSIEKCYKKIEKWFNQAIPIVFWHPDKDK